MTQHIPRFGLGTRYALHIRDNQAPLKINHVCEIRNRNDFPSQGSNRKEISRKSTRNLQKEIAIASDGNLQP